MSTLTDWGFRVRALFRSRVMEAELAEEMTFHLEMETRKLVAAGWSTEAASAEARRRFGVVSREQQRARDAWGLVLVTDFVADLRMALRQLRRQPGYTLLAVVTLGLGLGATVALSSVVVGLLVKPMPVADEARLQVFWDDYDWRGIEFDYVKPRQRAFDDLAAFSTEAYTLRLNGSSSMVLTGVVSAELFEVLGARPLLGRTFAPGEDRPGAEPVVVVSYGLWQQELGGDPQVVGRRLEFDGTEATVVGVMPRAFYFPAPEYRAWRPLDLDPSSPSYANNGFLALIGRVRADVGPGELSADVQSMASALGARFAYPQAWDKSRGAKLTSLRDYTVGDVRPAVLLLFGAVTLVLLVACANVAALVLARTSDRQSEMALRAALGAGRGRLMRQAVAESLALSTLAGLLGVALAVTGFNALLSRLPLRDGLERALSVDWTTLAIASGWSILVGLLVSLAPLRSLFASRALGVSTERSVGSRVRDHALDRALVAAEVALAVLLIAGATMLVRSVGRLYAIDAGFDPSRVLAMDVLTPAAIMPPADRRAFYGNLVERVERVPGVRAAGLITRLPLRDGGWQGPVTIEDRPDLRDGREPNAFQRPVSTRFFETMGIALLAGRGFTAQDREGTSAVGIVSESFARRLWPGGDPIGRRVSSRGASHPEWITIVGVVEEARMVRMTGENPIVLYTPLEQASAVPEGEVLLVKADAAIDVGGPIRALVRELDDRVAVARVTWLDDVIAASLAEPLRLRFFLSLLGALALALGAVGIYGVVSYSVTRRRTEYGVRLALGAAPSQILSDVVLGGLVPVAVGVVLGLAGALAMASVLTRFLYGIVPTDPLSLAAAGVALLSAGLVACAVPGMRAGRIDPVVALRAD